MWAGRNLRYRRIYKRIAGFDKTAGSNSRDKYNKDKYNKDKYNEKGWEQDTVPVLFLPPYLSYI